MSTMDNKVAVKLLIGFLILQTQILYTYQSPLFISTVSSADKEKVKLVIFLQNKTSTDYENGTRPNDEAQLDKTEAVDKLREQILLAKRNQLRIFAHDPEDILFMLTALVLLCFHLFFMDMFIRLTRSRFQTNSRYQYLSTVHLFLAFLVCAIYFLLILLHYRDSQYCG